MIWLARALFLWALLTRHRRRYVITWRERGNFGGEWSPWCYRRVDSDEPVHAWVSSVALADLLGQPVSVELRDCRILKRGGV